MKLIANLSMLGERPTGLGVYSEHCANALSSYFSVSYVAGQSQCPDGDVLITAPKEVSIGGGKLAALRRQIWMRGISFDENDLLYSPTHHGFPKVNGQIITVHDLICLRFPSQHKPQYLFFKFGLPKLLKKCRAVFCVSETTKADVAQTYGYPKDKIFVVPNGVDRSSFSVDKNARKAESPYLLMVGARYSHKNVDEVLQMSNLWSAKYRLLVTSCGGNYREHLEGLVAARGLQDRVKFLDYLSRDELVRLYQGCSALVYPSKWEGFGIPPLEALACGTSVIASDIPVHREVLGSSAIFVELGNESSWAKAFGVLNDLFEASDVEFSGNPVLDKYTWENSAKSLVDALLKVEPKLEKLLLK